MIKRENGNYVLFGGMDGDNGLWDRSLAIYEFDKNLDTLSTFFTSFEDEYIQVSHVLPINEEEVLLVAFHLDWDNIRNMHAYSHYIHRYNINNREIVWSKNYGSRASNLIQGGKIVSSHEDHHYLYCTACLLYTSPSPRD